MRRSYLDQYGEGEERRNSIILRAILTVVITTATVSFLWYIFRNFHQESLVRSFSKAVKTGDLKAAYRVWGCTDQKPCSGYDFNKFLTDWGPAATVSSGAPEPAVLDLTDSESCRNGVLLTLAVNPNRTEKLWVVKGEDAISFSPYPICPHKNPWSIMLHRTIGRLRKPLL